MLKSTTYTFLVYLTSTIVDSSHEIVVWLIGRAVNHGYDLADAFVCESVVHDFVSLASSSSEYSSS